MSATNQIVDGIHSDVVSSSLRTPRKLSDRDDYRIPVLSPPPQDRENLRGDSFGFTVASTERRFDIGCYLKHWHWPKVVSGNESALVETNTGSNTSCME